MEDGVFFEATQAEPLEGQAQTRAERRDQQTQRILEAAKACFVRSGFQGASMQQICAEGGMSPGALYRYFPSKEAIVEAICEADREDDMTASARSEMRHPPSTGWSKARWRISHIPTRTATPRCLPRCAPSPCATRRSRHGRRAQAGDRRNDRASRQGAIERGEIDPPVDLQTLLPS